MGMEHGIHNNSGSSIRFLTLSKQNIRIFNWENKKHNNQTQETMNTVFFLGETINGENHATSLEIESAPKVKPKIVRWYPDSSNLFLPFPSVFLFLSYALQLSVDECVSNRESNYLFILILDMAKTLLGLTSLGESNNPSALELRGL